MPIGEGYSEDRKRIERLLSSFEAGHGALPGIVDPAKRSALIEQIVDSEQRVKYFERLQSRTPDSAAAGPENDEFDPLRAAVIHRNIRGYDEAVWLVYLFVHFGKHRDAGWRYIRDIYGRLGEGGRWGWQEVSADPTMFRYWLEDHLDELQRPGPRGFGNHRKYESLNAWEDTGTGAAIESYVEWVLDGASNHEERFARFVAMSPEDGFAALFDAMKPIRRFGRIARFDYLTSLSRLKLLPISPPHSYLIGATGPLIGARLLLTDGGFDVSAKEAQDTLKELSDESGIGPDVLEDAICNWQKSPNSYVRFSG